MSRIVRGMRRTALAIMALALLGASAPAKPLDEVYRDAGYTSVKRAKAACERVFGRSIDLPKRKPPVPFTHRFARCVDAEGVANDTLEIEYVNEDKPMNRYGVAVYRRPLRGFPLRRQVVRTIPLYDGTTADLTDSSKAVPMAALFFARGGMQYVLKADGRIADRVSGDELAAVANTLPSETPMPIGRIAYNHDSETIGEARDRLDFALYAPRHVPPKWTLELKAYPPGSKRPSGIRLHFMDERDEHYLVGIVQTKTFLRKLTDKHGRIVWLNGRLARFSPWANSVRFPEGRAVPGGILRWIEGGTLIEMDSAVLTKRQMVRLARDMRVPVLSSS